MLRSGSDEYWKLKEQAEHIYRKSAEALGKSDAQKKWAEKGKDLVYEMRAEYGFSDENVEWLIKQYMLDRL